MGAEQPACALLGVVRLDDLDREFRVALEIFFRKRGCAASAAQDLTQDVFVRVIAYGRVHVIGNMRAFIFRTAANLLKDSARSARRWALLSLDDADADTDTRTRLVDPITPERILEARQEIAAFAFAFEKLDARTQQIVLMNRVENLRHRDIADQMGLSVSLIEKTLRTARRSFGAPREVEPRRQRPVSADFWRARSPEQRNVGRWRGART